MKRMKDWNKMNIEEYIEHLENKFQFDSSGTAKAVFELIAAYKALTISVANDSTSDKFGEICTAEKNGDQCILCKYLNDPIDCEACVYCMENLKYDDYYR